MINQSYRILLGAGLAMLVATVGAQTGGEAAYPSPDKAMQGTHTANRASHPDQVATRGETTYRQALRQCVKEPDPDQRDNCLDNAIEQFQRNG